MKGNVIREKQIIIPSMLSSVCSLGKKSTLLSKTFQHMKTTIRMVSTINTPQYPSERDRELVNDEFYELMGNDLIEEMVEAVEEPSPVFVFSWW